MKVQADRGFQTNSPNEQNPQPVAGLIGGLRQPMHASNYSDFTHQLKIDRPLAMFSSPALPAYTQTA